MVINGKNFSKYRTVLKKMIQFLTKMGAGKGDDINSLYHFLKDGEIYPVIFVNQTISPYKIQFSPLIAVAIPSSIPDDLDIYRTDNTINNGYALYKSQSVKIDYLRKYIDNVSEIELEEDKGIIFKTLDVNLFKSAKDKLNEVDDGLDDSEPIIRPDSYYHPYRGDNGDYCDSLYVKDSLHKMLIARTPVFSLTDRIKLDFISSKLVENGVYDVEYANVNGKFRVKLFYQFSSNKVESINIHKYQHICDNEIVTSVGYEQDNYIVKCTVFYRYLDIWSVPNFEK